VCSPAACHLRHLDREHGRSLIEIATVLAIFGVVAAMSVPLVANALAYFRVSGDARSISNAIAVVKIRAASSFTQTRLFVDLTGKKHRSETWDKTTSHWTTEGGEISLSNGVMFGYGPVTNAPPNSQSTIDQAPKCKDDAGTDIGNSACVIFNSRGVPVDSLGAPTGVDALYVTDGRAIYGVTLSATGMTRNWRTFPATTATWVQQ
jgi:hypothetical protein